MKWLDFTEFLRNLKLSEPSTFVINKILLITTFVVASILSFYIFRFFIKKIIYKIIKITRNEYDNTLIKNKIFELIAHILPVLILFYGVEFIFGNKPIMHFLNKFIYAYLTIVSMILFFRILNAVNDIFEIYARKNNLNIHIKQFVEVVKVIVVLAVVLILLSIFFKIKVSNFLTGLGAFTAVLILVFKDTILSFVASIQLNVYRLLSVGDWVNIPSKNVEGTVIDLSLNLVKIRNSDNTLTTVPTYLLTQEPFINWKSMEESGGRRIKRSLLFNANTITMATHELLQRLKNLPYLQNYIDQYLQDQQNSKTKIYLTNLTLFRIYVENYIRSNLRSFRKFEKVAIEKDGHQFEKFLVTNPDEYIQRYGEKFSNYLEVIDDKTYISSTGNFLLAFANNFITENDYIYEIQRISKKIIVEGTEIETYTYNKIIEKEGLFCDDLRILVRELQPTDLGVPLEIIVFTATTKFTEYERIQSEFFEHLYAIIPLFDLKLFQRYSS